MGLGHSHYYFPEKGATSPIDRIPDQLKDTVRSIHEMKCLKPGLNAPSDVGYTVSGLVAVDASSYELLGDRLSKIRSKLAKKEMRIRSGDFENLERPAHTVTLSARRNLKDKNFNSYISFQDRREIEETVLKALQAEFPKGEYFPLPGNDSRERKPMSKDLQDLLRSKGLIFEAPWSVYDLSCGFGRHWPDARGVFILPAVGETELVVFLNADDHMQIVAKRKDGDQKICLTEINSSLNRIEKYLTFETDSKNGFLTSRPETSGTGLDISGEVNLIRLNRHAKFLPLCHRLRLEVTESDEKKYHLSSFERFELSPEEAVERTDYALGVILHIEELLNSKETEQQGLRCIEGILSS
jgi:hypothetical protein